MNTIAITLLLSQFQSCIVAMTGNLFGHVQWHILLAIATANQFKLVLLSDAILESYIHAVDRWLCEMS